MKTNAAAFLIVFVLGVTGGYVMYNQSRPAPERPRTDPPLTQQQRTAVETQAYPVTRQPQPPSAPMKPERTPPELKRVFAENTDLEPKIAEIKAIATMRSTPELIEALRWILHQPDTSEILRDEIASVLADWDAATTAMDLHAMVIDTRCSETWRRCCVGHLQEIHLIENNVNALMGLFKAAQSRAVMVNEAALLALAKISSEHEWYGSSQERYRAISGLIRKALASEQPKIAAAAMRAIAIADMRELVPAVERFASDDAQDMAVRLAATKTLGKVGRAQSAPVLEACTKSRNKTLKRYAQDALTRLKQGKP